MKVKFYYKMNLFDESIIDKFCFMMCKLNESRFKRKGREMEYRYIVVNF